MVKCDRCGKSANQEKPTEVEHVIVSVGPITCGFELCAPCKKGVADVAFAEASKSKASAGVPNLPQNR